MLILFLVCALKVQHLLLPALLPEQQLWEGTVLPGPASALGEELG